MKETNELPFFARFLESQETLKVRTNLKAGIRSVKFPSEGDEDVTHKYPSDGDEEGPTS